MVESKCTRPQLACLGRDNDDVSLGVLATLS